MSQASARNEAAAVDFLLPAIGEGIYEAEFVRWLVKPGDMVKSGQTLAEVMTDKATMEVPAPFAGTIVELRAEPGAQVKVGAVLLTYRAASSNAPTNSSGPTVRTPLANGPARASIAPPAAQLPARASPSVRQLARQRGIDLATIAGSGPDGRILLEDLDARPAPRTVAPAAEAKHEFGTPGTRIKVFGLRRRIAEHMVLAKRTIPHYSLIEECDVTELVQLRTGLKEKFAAAGVKLTYLAFAVKAVVAALKEFPLINSSLDESAGEIVLHDRYHVGIAVATPAGLVVPVVHDADRQDLPALAREIDRLTNDARANRSKPDDFKGGTFTVTSVGNVGGLISTPVINHPEAGILGLGRIVKRPVYDEHDMIRPAQILYLSLSFDHRIVDGAVGAAFTNAVVRELRNPAGLLVGSI